MASQKDAYYFSHDSNASSDPKISAMINQYGIEGYGRFWIIVEILREQQEYRLPLKGYVFNALAMRLQCDFDAAEKYVKDCIENHELFDSDGQYFWSNSLVRRMKQKEDRSRQASEAAKKRWEHSGGNADAMQTQCGSNAIKGKESKVKDKDRSSSSIPVRTEIFTAFEKEFGRLLSPMEIEQLKGWEKEHSQELILEALKRAALGGNHTFKYINGILLRWTKNNIRTIQEVERHEADYQARKPGPGRIRGAPAILPTQMDKLDKWAEEGAG